MKLLDLNPNQARKEFGARWITLNSGQAGLRGGMPCKVKDVDGDDPVLEFIGSDGSVDRYNEVIDQSGWQLENFRANPVIPDCHDYSSIGKILGRADSVDVINGQLINRVRFCLDNPMGLLAYKMAKGGFVNSQSVGFIPLEWTNGNAAGQPDRTYTQCELLEISLVVVPANPGATVGLAFKSGAIERADLLAAIKFLGGLCNAGQSGTDFCSEETDPAAPGGTSGAGVHDVRLLQLARGLRDVLKN